MTQTEIQFFWPLTEQTDLDLDFSQCSPHQYYMRAQGIAGVHGPFNTGMTYVSAPGWTSSKVQINTDELTIKTPNMPWYRKLAYKLMGFKWE
jgi:hypothetical protein